MESNPLLESLLAIVTCFTSNAAEKMFWDLNPKKIYRFHLSILIFTPGRDSHHIWRLTAPRLTRYEKTHANHMERSCGGKEMLGQPRTIPTTQVGCPICKWRSHLGLPAQWAFKLLQPQRHASNYNDMYSPSENCPAKPSQPTKPWEMQNNCCIKPPSFGGLYGNM